MGSGRTIELPAPLILEVRDMPITDRRKTTDSQQEIITQLALLNEQFSSLKATVERSVDDHETRIRRLESDGGNLSKDIATIRERMTIFNLMQGSLTAVAASLAYWLKK